jgi:FAD/FMN-containing dehydrogenase
LKIAEEREVKMVEEPVPTSYHKSGVDVILEAIRKEEPVRIPENKKKEVIEALRKVTSPERVRDELYVRAHYRGASFLSGAFRELFCRVPDIVVYPESTEEVQGILKVASEYEVPVTTVGTQSTSISGAPISGGIVLDVMKMKRIHKIDLEHSYVVVEPGVTIYELMEKIRPEGYMTVRGTYPPSFSVLNTLTAVCTGGDMANRMADQVIGAEIVMADGSVLYSGTAVDPASEHWSQSGVRGYPWFLNLFRPSAATVGVITKAAIRIWPLLDETALPVFGFDDFESAVRWSHAMSKSSMVDQTMVWHWTTAFIRFLMVEGLLDFMEAKMNLQQEEAPRELGLYNCYGFAQMRGYKEEVAGAVEAAKRLARQYNGKYVPEEELRKTMPEMGVEWLTVHKEFQFEWLTEAERRHEPLSGPSSEGRLNYWGAGSVTMIGVGGSGSLEEIIKLYKGLVKKLKEYGWKNWPSYTRMHDYGQTVSLASWAFSEIATKEEARETARIGDEISEWIRENYQVNVTSVVIDPENPENIAERAIPIQRLMSVVRKEFDPKNIMNPFFKKYSLI